jgi:Protein of unknown function (DUF2478)
MRSSPTDTLAAIVYEPGAGNSADSILAEVADRLARRGLRVAGAVQQPSDDCAELRCNLVDVDLQSGEKIALWDNPGKGARGCRLDSQALAALADRAMAIIGAGADALIVSRSGKREPEGGGFRVAIGVAVAQGLPVLVSVSTEHLEALRTFTDGLTAELSPTREAAARWLDAVERARSRSEFR